MKNKLWFRYLITIVAVIASSFLQTYAIKVFVEPANLLSSGFTGVAILIDRITSLYGFNFSTSLGAILCFKSIGKKFVISSLCQVFLTSFLLRICTFPPLFNDVILNVFFGGFVYGMSTVIALRGNTSSAGTDFIALYVSNKMGKSIWEYVFIFNALILCIFGYMFGWIYAGYSIVFQFISTKTISSFYQRYKRVTLQITTTHPEQIIERYVKDYRQAGYRVYEISSKDNHGLEELKTVFKDKVSVITGQSGVGKSSFLNALDINLKLETNEISKSLGRGKHTTRHVELLKMYGGYLGDTPGFSSLELEMTPEELAVAYHDFAQFSHECKFRGCLHDSEPNCGVKKAVEDGKISKERYEHYLMNLQDVKKKEERKYG